MGGPVARFDTGAAQHPFADRDDEADLFGQGHEFGGHHEAARRMAPPQQRLETADAVEFQIVDRLIIDLELVVLERVAQIELQQPARLQARVHFRFEEPPGAAPVRLGAVKRDIGAFEQLVEGDAVARGQRNADARADRDAMSHDIVRGAQDLDDAMGQQRGLFRARHLALHDGEFIAARPRHGVALAHAVAQALGDRAQQFVADMMAERIVDLFEAIKIETEHRKAALAPGAGDRFLDFLAE